MGVGGNFSAMMGDATNNCTNSHKPTSTPFVPTVISLCSILNNRKTPFKTKRWIEYMVRSTLQEISKLSETPDDRKRVCRTGVSPSLKGVIVANLSSCAAKIIGDRMITSVERRLRWRICWAPYDAKSCYYLKPGSKGVC